MTYRVSENEKKLVQKSNWIIRTGLDRIDQIGPTGIAKSGSVQVGSTWIVLN